MKRNLTQKELERHEKGRDIWTEILDGVNEIKTGGGRKFKVTPNTEAARTRMKTGLSQAQFASLLGVSKRTLEQWEQGRRQPSGAAKTLLKITEINPKILKVAFGRT